MTFKEVSNLALFWLHVEDGQFSQDVFIDFKPEVGKFYALYQNFKNNEIIESHKEITKHDIIDCFEFDYKSGYEHEYFDWLLVYVVDENEAIGFIENGYDWLYLEK